MNYTNENEKWFCGIYVFLDENWRAASRKWAYAIQ